MNTADVYDVELGACEVTKDFLVRLPMHLPWVSLRIVRA